MTQNIYIFVKISVVSCVAGDTLQLHFLSADPVSPQKFKARNRN